MPALAPVEYVVIDFPGNRFTGDIVPAIVDLVDRSVVRVLDLVFVKKDADGVVATFEYDELDDGSARVAVGTLRGRRGFSPRSARRRTTRSG